MILLQQCGVKPFIEQKNKEGGFLHDTKLELGQKIDRASL